MIKQKNNYHRLKKIVISIQINYRFSVALKNIKQYLKTYVKIWRAKKYLRRRIDAKKIIESLILIYKAKKLKRHLQLERKNIGFIKKKHDKLKQQYEDIIIETQKEKEKQIILQEKYNDIIKNKEEETKKHEELESDYNSMLESVMQNEVNKVNAIDQLNNQMHQMMLENAILKERLQRESKKKEGCFIM